MNPDFSQNHTLPYAPFGSQYETPGMGVLDLIMTNDDGNDTYMAHGLSRLEKLAHGMHMLELWHKTSKVYDGLKWKFGLEISDDLCSCLTDETQNGIMNELVFISKYMRNFGKAERNSDRLPALNNPASWTAWKNMLAFSMLHEDEIEYFAKYMYCKIHNDV